MLRLFPRAVADEGLLSRGGQSDRVVGVAWRGPPLMFATHARMYMFGNRHYWKYINMLTGPFLCVSSNCYKNCLLAVIFQYKVPLYKKPYAQSSPAFFIHHIHMNGVYPTIFFKIASSILEL